MACERNATRHGHRDLQYKAEVCLNLFIYRLSQIRSDWRSLNVGCCRLYRANFTQGPESRGGFQRTDTCERLDGQAVNGRALQALRYLNQVSLVLIGAGVKHVVALRESHRGMMMFRKRSMYSVLGTRVQGRDAARSDERASLAASGLSTSECLPSGPSTFDTDCHVFGLSE